MTSELPEPAEHKRRVPVKLIVIFAAVLIFAVGMAVEVYKHSDSRMKSLLSENKQSFEACAEFFAAKGVSAPSDSNTSPENDDARKTGTKNDPKRSSYASVDFLSEKYEGEPVSEDIKKLADAGVQKITLNNGEVRFYTDVNSGICYISKEVQSQPGFYYPEGYLDENRVDGDWYRFGEDVKRNK